MQQHSASLVEGGLFSISAESRKMLTVWWKPIHMLHTCAGSASVLGVSDFSTELLVMSSLLEQQYLQC
jgi:hypothetical protein